MSDVPQADYRTGQETTPGHNITTSEGTAGLGATTAPNTMAEETPTTNATSDTTAATAAPAAPAAPVSSDATDEVPKDDTPKGIDPAIEELNPDKKLTGTAQPGSHSALFGLTPDGHKETESSSKTTAPQATTGDQKTVTGNNSETTTASNEGASGDTGSRQGGGGEELKRQMNDPRQGESEGSTDVSAGKIGAGSSLATPEQGTGAV